MQRQEDHQQACQAHPVVVVQISRLVDELYVREQQEERGDGESISVTQRHAQACEAKQGEVNVHPPTRPCLDLPETRIREVMYGIDVEFGNPSLGRKTADRSKAQQSEHDPEGGGGRSANRPGAQSEQSIEASDNRESVAFAHRIGLANRHEPQFSRSTAWRPPTLFWTGGQLCADLICVTLFSGCRDFSLNGEMIHA